MRRALIALLIVAIAAITVPALASGINFNDKKGLEAEIERRVQKQLQAYQPQIDMEKKKAEQYQRSMGITMQTTQTPETAKQAKPAITCKVGGCSNELCVPVIDGVQIPGEAAISACQYMSFYACYKGATCALSKDKEGNDICRWQETGELRSCLQQQGGNVGLAHAGFQ